MRSYCNVRRSQEVEIDSQLQEIAAHGSSILPIAIYIDEFQEYSIPIIQRHWHREIQFNVVLCGSVQFVINGESIIVNQGEGIFINSNIMHMSSPLLEQNTKMCSVLFEPTMLSGSNQVVIENKYVRPIVRCAQLKYLFLSLDVDWQLKILIYLRRILDSEEDKVYGYELEIRNYLGELWLLLARNSEKLLAESSIVSSVDEERIKKMLEFIHGNFHSDINLEDIANSAGLSKSECCRCFQRMIQTSPFEYLINQRIFSAAKMLAGSNKTINEIAESVGFHGLSYFYKRFKNAIGITPLEYRKQYHKPGNQ